MKKLLNNIKTSFLKMLTIMKKLFEYGKAIFSYKKLVIIAYLLSGLAEYFIPAFREFLLSMNPVVKEWTTVVSTFILAILLAHYVDKFRAELGIRNKHYPKSFDIVKKKILPSYYENSKSSNKTNLEINNNIDKIIKSPIDYTNETLSGNQPPIFNPNEDYLEEIYSEDLTHIVAITAENPNLWLDPTLCFYMLNCCAVSLINKVNSVSEGKIKLVMKDFPGDTDYASFVRNETEDILQDLKRFKAPKDFEFIRFLIFSEDQKECLKSTVFPAIKASQDLFRIKSFFLQKDKIQDNLRGNYPLYSAFIENIWNRIKDYHNFTDEEIKVIEKRKREHIPEFLFLFKKNKNVTIHTYINGKAYKTLLNNHIKSVHSDYEAAHTFIAYLADCRLENEKCDWYPMAEDNNLNKTKSYIDLCVEQSAQAATI